MYVPTIFEKCNKVIFFRQRFIKHQFTTAIDHRDFQSTPNQSASCDGTLNSSTVDHLRGKLADAVTPLWRIPYPEQLILKDQMNLEIMKKLSKRLKPNSLSNNIVCQLHKTLPSPAVLHYRNKNQYHVRYDSSGKAVVGMCIGKASEGTLQCISSDGLLNMHPTHSDVAKHFQDYVQHHSKWKICEHFKQGGHWRQLKVRSNYKNELMIVVTIHPQDLCDQEIREEMERMKEYLLSCSINQLISIYYQSCRHTCCSSEQSPFILLHGASHIFERIGEYEFRISPESFFQVNTEGARVLYDTVARQLKPERLSTVVDVCCGTGTQGIMVARHCRGVVGIDLSLSSIEDARFNATHNKVYNAEFFNGRVEKHFERLMEQLDVAPDIVAIVNPSRIGLGDKVIRLLRDNERIRHLVYISCQADGPAMNNFVTLCQRPNRGLKSEPFQLRAAIPVDMFPHTNHCELVLSFHR